ILKMASTSAVEQPPGTEEHVFEEEIEEETVWMDEDEVFVQNGKKMVMDYNEGQGELAAQEDEYQEQEVDVEQYDEDSMRHHVSFVTQLHLPDALSKKIPLGNNSFLTQCFSKRGLLQIAVEGFLYNLSHHEHSNATWVCINEECNGHIVTSWPLSSEEIVSIERNNDIHTMCQPDETQIRLRIAIYDLRLMAEFTDCHLPLLYDNFVRDFAQGSAISELFPPFNSIRRSLEEHRKYKTYRSVFESVDGDVGKIMMEDIDRDDRTLVMSGEEVVEESYNERVPMEGELAINRHHHMNPYGRQRGFPPTSCFECNIDMESHGRVFSPQQALIQHVDRIHQPVKILDFVFEAAAFEMWLREVQRCPVLRFRRFNLIGEDMYYLCACDMRLPRSKYTQSCHCTAYIKIADYRRVCARELRLVSIEYSFEHFAHQISLDNLTAPPEKMIADLRPEDFLLEMERRKVATANLVRSNRESTTRKERERIPLSNSVAMRNNLPPVRPGVRAPEHVFSASRSESRTAAARQVAISGGKTPLASRLSVRPCGSKSLGPTGNITKRSHFKDQTVFEAVRQFEQLSHIVIRRLQSVKSAKIADHYSEIMRRMVNRIVTDIDCAPEGSAQSVWCGLNTARNGRNPASKREREEEEMEEGEEGEEGERSAKKRARKERDVDEEGEAEAEAEKDGEEKREDGGKGVIPKEEESLDGSEGDNKGMKTRGRSQLPVKSTLVATGRVIEKEKGVIGVREGVTPQSVRRRVVIPTAKVVENSLLPITPRSKSTRIQARKEKIDGGEMEEKKTPSQ
ncbi:hypothetical protein PENTCL1PPCAC_23087, partial [Pristionchus entomophagus]